MSKRRAGVNDIIYELNNDDVEISSEDEVKEVKIQRLESPKNAKIKPGESLSDSSSPDVIDIDSSPKGNCVNASSADFQNGGKTSPEVILSDFETETPKPTEQVDSSRKENPESFNKMKLYNEDIAIDSPASNSDLGVVGCENRTPLITVRFRDKKMAKAYKEEVKAFMLKLMRLHDEENLTGSETETDLELDVWPEDIEAQEHKQEEVDSLFFVDTAPGIDVNSDIPTYKQNTMLISNAPEKEPTPPPVFRRGPICFNCDGSHPLRDCIEPRNNQRIAENRKTVAARIGRYHVEDDQKYGHLIPGRISGHLRHALGLKRHELPGFIYKMRLLGYPPGWLEEARISHSGITMFDSTGQKIQDPEEEDGEVYEPGSRDKFDIKKILDFPGFNVPASSRYKEEGHLYGVPPISEQDSKLAMLQMLAPNAMKAYKRKKLTFFPSASANNSLQGPAEMELDSGDEVAEFPSVPPLPDEPPPPPPASPPPPPPASLPASPPPPPPPVDENSADDLEVIQVIKVPDIPIPMDDFITIDDDDKSQLSRERGSPTLDDLEEKKRKLLSALEGDTDVSISDIGEMDESETKADSDEKEDEIKTTESNASTLDSEVSPNTSAEQLNISDIKTSASDIPIKPEDITGGTIQSADSGTTVTNIASSDIPKTPEDKAGTVKSTDFGTPVMNIASSYKKLPSDHNFAKDICDVINFENLPNSIGKYKQISSLLKKVKNEVDRIQDS